MKLSILTKLAALSAFLTIGSYFTTASADTVDLGVLVPGQTYSWPQYATVTGRYTPSETGPVKFEYTTTQLNIYTSPDHKDESKVQGTFSYTDGGKVMSYDKLIAGTTYYVYNAFAMDEGSLVIHEGTSEIKLLGTLPSVDPTNSEYYGGKLSASKTYEVVVNFNFPITVGNIFLVAPDNTRIPVTSKVNGTSVGCDIAPAMMQLYHDGKIKEGDEVTLRLLQVTDAADSNNKYNRNGRCEVNFTVAAKPIELVEIIGADRNSIENELKSYYLSGDEAGVIKFVFDGPLSKDKKAVASITYGNSDNLEVGVYSEDIVASNEDNTAIFDFSGKRRRPIDMLPASDASTQPDGLFISFGNIYSPDGQWAYTASKSNPAGFPVSFKINVLQYTVVGDFTPARGTALKFGEPMEIWVMNGDKIIYDTIRFEYKENGEDKYYDLPRSEVKEEADPYSSNAMLYTFIIPTLPCDADSPVYVRMTGIQCADGLDHSNDVYGDFKQASSGIEDIIGDGADTFDVYDITGVRVLSGVTNEALSNLAKGIYIINGKKIVIR